MEQITKTRAVSKRAIAAMVGAGIAVPFLGTLLLARLGASWSWMSLPVHSTLVVAGAGVGIVLALLLLQSQRRVHGSRQLWIACALMSMGILDIFHACMPAGRAFVWLHGLAVLFGGVFFALAWLPDREVSARTVHAVAAAIVVGAALVAALSATRPDVLPAMLRAGEFTATARALNFVGCGLTLLGALYFAFACARSADLRNVLFLMLCLLIGVSGVVFHLSEMWDAGWWFWKVVRLAGYVFAFWLVMRSYRRAENQLRECRDRLDVIDVFDRPDLAYDDLVLATPTLIKALPPPVRRIVGDLSDKKRVLAPLELVETE